jgi:hypothetical protein
MTTLIIDIATQTGQFADITYCPTTGGSIYIGYHELPFTWVTDIYEGGFFSVYFPDTDKQCGQCLITPTPTPTPTITPTQTPTNTPTPTPTPTPFPEGCNIVITVDGECLNVNGGFDYNLDGWTYNSLSASWEPTWGGSCGLKNPEFTGGCISQDILEIGKIYQIEFDIQKTSSIDCNENNIYIEVFAGSNSSGFLMTGPDNTEHISISLVCTDNTSFKICTYYICTGGPYIILDNICVNEINAITFCDTNLFIMDTECDVCFNESENPEGSQCFAYSNVIPATNNFEVLPTGSTSFASGGTLFRNTISIIPAQVLNGENEIIATNNTGIWSNVSPNDSTNGPLNRCAVYFPSANTLPNDYVLLGIKISPTCIDPELTGKTFCIGIGGGEFYIKFLKPLGSSNQLVSYLTYSPAWINPTEKTNNWNVYEFYTEPDRNDYYFEIFGTKSSFIGFEVYNQPMSTLTAVTTVDDLKIILSSSALTKFEYVKNDNGTIEFSGGPKCPEGFFYDVCIDKCIGKINCSQNNDCLPCNPMPLPNPAVPSVNYGDNVLTYTYVGPGLIPYAFDVSCGNISDPPNSVFLGNSVGDFTYTIYFSKPINEIEILSVGGGAYVFPFEYEEFIFNTNAGIPQLITCDFGCLSYIDENKYYTTSDGTILGSLQFKISAETEFTELTISGAGGYDGCVFAICSQDISNIFEQFPQLFTVKTAFVYYDYIGAPVLPPPPPPSAYTSFVYYET